MLPLVFFQEFDCSAMCCAAPIIWGPDIVSVGLAAGTTDPEGTAAATEKGGRGRWRHLECVGRGDAAVNECRFATRRIKWRSTAQ